jgi:hypothetical protein
MTEQIVATLRAERGGKYEETGQCISSYNRSIVFLPRSVKPDEVVRVRLIPIDGKIDRNNRPMYRSEFAPLDLTMEVKQTIANEAQQLRTGNALPREQGEAILRAKGVAGVSGYGWYYFCGDKTFGSNFPPSALAALEVLPHASGAGLIELIAWITESGYYSATQERGDTRTPDVPDSAITSIVERTSRQERVLSVGIQ